MTAHRARRVLGLMLAIVALVAGGCGGSDTKADYKKDAKAIIDPLRETLNSSNARVGAATSDRARIRELDQTRRAVATAARELDELKPPKSAEVEHDNFVISLRKFAKDIQAVERAIQDNDQRAARRAVARLRRSAAEVKQANDELKAKVDE